MIQTIFSALWGQNQNRIKTNKNPPNSQKAAGRDVRSLKEQTNPDGGDKVVLLSLMHICVNYCCVFRHIHLPTRGGGGNLRNGHVIFPASPQLFFPFTSSSRIQVFIFQGSAVNDDRSRCETDFQNTDFASLKALLHVGHTAQRQSSRQPDGAMTLTKQKRETKTKPPHFCLFSN